MATALHPDQDSFVSLLEMPPEADLVAELRAINASQSSDFGSLWQIVVEEGDLGGGWGTGPTVSLDVGIAGASGALRWAAHRHVYIPASGAQRLERKDDWLPYFDWSGLASSIHGAMEAPIELVFEAVAEVVATRQQPTCVDWLEINYDNYRLIGG